MKLISGLPYYLNPYLLRKQHIEYDSPRYEALVRSHHLKFSLITKMANSDNDDELIFLARMIDNLEYVQQELWGFEQDANFHLFWEMPHCGCVKYENYQRWGRPDPIYSPKCRIHKHKILLTLEN